MWLASAERRRAALFEGLRFRNTHVRRAVTGDDDLHIDIMLCIGQEGLAW